MQLGQTKKKKKILWNVKEEWCGAGLNRKTEIRVWMQEWGVVAPVWRLCLQKSERVLGDYAWKWLLIAVTLPRASCCTDLHHIDGSARLPVCWLAPRVRAPWHCVCTEEGEKKNSCKNVVELLSWNHILLGHYVPFLYSTLKPVDWGRQSKWSLVSVNAHTGWRLPLTFSGSAPLRRGFRLIPLI